MALICSVEEVPVQAACSKDTVKQKGIQIYSRHCEA